MAVATFAAFYFGLYLSTAYADAATIMVAELTVAHLLFSCFYADADAAINNKYEKEQPKNIGCSSFL